MTLPEPSGGAQGRACVGGASLKRELPAMKDIPIRRDGVYRPIYDSGRFQHICILLLNVVSLCEIQKLLVNILMPNFFV